MTTLPARTSHPPSPRGTTRRALASWLIAVLLLALPATAQPADTLLTLEEALAQAETNAFALRRARLDAALATNDFSLGNAGYLPRAGLEARQAGSGLNRGSDLGATAGYTLLDATRGPRYQTLRAERDRAEAALALADDLTRADVVVAYYALVRGRQQLAVLRDAIAVSQERLAIAELRLELGSAAEQEVRRARVALNEDRAALLFQEATLAERKAAFNQLLGRRATLTYTVIDTIAVDTTLRLAALEANASARNPALRLDAAAREAARQEGRAVRRERLPRVDLSVGYTPNDLLGAAPRPTNLPGGLFYGLTASLDLFDGLDRRRRIERARLRLRDRSLGLEERRSQILNALAGTYARYTSSLGLVALERENRDLAAQNVEVALESFRVGTITSVELREVQNALVRAESRLVDARFDAKAAETELRRLGGRL